MLWGRVVPPLWGPPASPTVITVVPPTLRPQQILTLHLALEGERVKVSVTVSNLGLMMCLLQSVPSGSRYICNIQYLVQYLEAGDIYVKFSKLRQ